MKRATAKQKTLPAKPQIRDDELESRVKHVVSRTLSRNIPGLPQLDTELDVGPTPKEVVYTKLTSRLYHYKPLVDEIYRVPVLIVMSPVARGYILDLAKGQSLVEYLLLQGHDVYMIDWMPPRREHASVTLSDLVETIIAECIEQIRADSGEPDVTLIGYCMGGVLAAMYTALDPDGPVKNLACFTTPVNSEGMVLYKKWVEAKAFDIDMLVDQLGNIPSDMVNASIQVLRPLQQSANEMKLLNNVDNDAFVKAHLRFSRWAADQLAVPGEVARELVKEFLRGNKLVKKEYRIGNRLVDLGKIRVPFLHVAAEYDHIVPPAASRDLVALIGSKDKQEIVVKGGHVSLVAGGNAVYRLWPQLDRWLAERGI
ncbi:MAG: alpha/beta fold hydrolase [Gammaproteobacteria bacterium]|nr:alpha/beta fold hydrolase [Gammaproteobacteria bacterium]